MRILVTGGAGYIGSHTILEFLREDHSVVALDNLSNSSSESLRRVERLSGVPCPLHRIDLLDLKSLRWLFNEERIEGVIHFAGLKAVGESVEKPLLYYRNNVTGTLNLLEAMSEAGVKKMVFSSSCTVYGDPATVPVSEDFPLGATNPYGRTKWMIEEILRDLHHSDPDWSIALLRYFNPVGADPSGEIGEDPKEIPNNLMPYISQIAVGQRKELQIFGGDYPTRDGTGIRDYIHVSDLARGHLLAWHKLSEKPGLYHYNLGTGRGSSVLELLRAFEKVSGRKIPHRIVERRAGDVAESWADPSRALKELGWRAERNLEDICRDAWNWQTKNPKGYDSGK